MSGHEGRDMVAAVVDRYGPPEVVRFDRRPVPAAGRGQILVRVAAAGVNSGDARIRGARFPPGFGPFARVAFGIRRPRRQVLGNTFSGEVEAVGPGVAASGELAPGARVAGMTGVAMGAHATHLVIDAGRAVPVPAGVSHQQAAGLLFGATTAAQFLRRADERRARRGSPPIGPGMSVLVIGASGAVGTNVVQLAAGAGATVTGVCSAANAALVRRLGASTVLDRTAFDPGPDSRGPDSRRWDVVVDTVGELGLAAGRQLLAPGGVLLLVAAGLVDTVRARGDVVAGPAPERTEEMSRLLGMVADGSLEVVFDDVVPLASIVEAYRRVDSGRKVGNLVLDIGLEPSAEPT